MNCLETQMEGGMHAEHHVSGTCGKKVLDSTCVLCGQHGKELDMSGPENNQ